MSDINISKIRRLDGGLLLIFQELMHHRRTTIVAERLNLTQPAVSHALARLREIFEDPLFNRRPNGLEPTQRSLELAPRIEELIRQTQITLDTGKAFDPASTSRNFRIGGGDFMSALLAAPLLKQFEQNAPNASFVFRFSLGQEALDSLRRDDIDVAVGRLHANEQEFITEELYQEEYCIVARERNPHINNEIDLTLFSKLNHVIISLGNDMAQLGDDNLKERNIERRVVAAVPRFLTAFTLIAESDAIMTVQKRLASRYAKPFKLEIYPVPYPTDKVKIVAVCRRVDKSDEATRWLIEQIKTSAC